MKIPAHRLELKLRTGFIWPYCNYPFKRVPQKPTRCPNCREIVVSLGSCSSYQLDDIKGACR